MYKGLHDFLSLSLQYLAISSFQIPLENEALDLFHLILRYPDMDSNHSCSNLIQRHSKHEISVARNW
jgi:nitrate reductase assembly molybdenum cofactor insertion protein NarJ